MVNGCLALATQNEILKGFDRRTSSYNIMDPESDVKESAKTINQEAGFGLDHLASIYLSEHRATLTHQPSKHKKRLNIILTNA